MYSWVRLKDLVEWTKGELSGTVRLDLPIRVLSTDTRTLAKGDVFVALKGEKFDANQFFADAAAKGASLIIAEKAAPGTPTLVVPDALKALAAIGRELRRNFKGPVVAITGSAGKSSTKEMVATLLGDGTLKSPASFNNLLGVSKTLALVEDGTKRLVLEMGMNSFGEIAELCEFFAPQIGAITNIGDAHIGKLGGKDGIYRAKKELFDFLGKNTATKGVAVNADDPMVVKAYRDAIGNKIRAIQYSAQGKDADVSVKSSRINPDNGFLDLLVHTRDTEFSVEIPIFGKHHAENLAAAIAVAFLMEVPVKEVQARLKTVQPAYHRGEVLTLPDGRILIDESYNSNPTALKSALSTLGEMDEKRRRILVIGEMKELGEFSETLHREIGQHIVALYSEKKAPFILIGVGAQANAIVDEVRKKLPSIPWFHYPHVKEAIGPVQALYRSTDILFVKGSRGVELDQLVSAISKNNGKNGRAK